MQATSLLCTFCNEDELAVTLETIKQSYTIAFNSIYVLENLDTPRALCITYNVIPTDNSQLIIPDSTISLHRKKATNTLYTINALNLLIEELNGEFSKGFRVPWDDYSNTILVTAYGRLKKIHTRLRDIVKLESV